MMSGRGIVGVGVWVVHAIYGLAGTAKLLELDRFENHLGMWTIVPGFAVPALALIVPSLEIVLAGLWLTRRRTARVVFATLMLSMVLGLTSVVQYLANPVPDCGCFGALARYAQLNTGLPKIIGFNVVAIALLAAQFVLMRRGRRPLNSHLGGESDPSARVSSKASAFTLIETILTVAIAAILVALLVPSLAGARRGAQDMASLSNMRQHASVFSAYATDSDDYSPYPVNPRATLNVFRGGGLVVEAEYFWVTEFWQVALADDYYDGAVFSDSFSHPADRPRGTWITYRMTSSFLADPRYWVDRPERDTSLWGPVRVTQARYPADKAWLVEFHPEHGPPVGLGSAGQAQEKVGLAFVDTHAERLDGPELTVPLFHGDGLVEQARFRLGIFGMHTPDGAHGRDKR